MKRPVVLAFPLFLALIACGPTAPADTTAPTVVSRAPIDAASNVFLKDEISITFNEAILPSSVTASTVQLKHAGVVTASSASLDTGGTKLIVRPTVLPTLPAAMSVVVNGITDKAGNVAVVPTVSFQAPLWQQPGSQPLASTTISGELTSPKSLALDPNGNPLVVFNEGNSIRVKAWNGSTWNLLGDTPLNVGGNNQHPAIAVDSSGKPSVTWSEFEGTSFNVYVKSWNGTAWTLLGGTFMDVNGNVRAEYPGITVNANGNPTVSWTEGDNGGSKYVYVKTWTGTSWVLLGGTFLNVNGGNAETSAVALDSSGKPSVVWTEFVTGIAAYVHLKSWNGSAWTTRGGKATVKEYLDTANPKITPSFPNIAMDSSNNPTLAWRAIKNLSNDIAVANWNDPAWTFLDNTSLVANPRANQNPLFSSMALTSSGKPTVAWAEPDASGYNVYLRTWDGSAWKDFGNDVVNLLDVNAGADALNPSVALDAAGQPVVAWFENNSGSLKVYVKRFNRIP
jgi:Bacterial Ig-like domain